MGVLAIADKMNLKMGHFDLTYAPTFVCSRHFVVSLDAPPTTLSDCLHLTSNSLSTLKAAVPQTGREEHIFRLEHPAG